LLVGQWIYDALVTGNVSAWHYWWLVPAGSDNEGLLLQDGTKTKRLYVLGNFSKFVRPGWERIDVTGAPSSLRVVAFHDPVSQRVAIVAMNAGTSDVNASFFVGGTAWPDDVTPWVTSASDDLASKTSVALAGARFTATVSAMSAVTFVSP
jgi:glucuronoarabinoxylan endo-1,4-beta-xylanase